jgi:predicted ATP-binding protein involved in virulence
MMLERLTMPSHIRTWEGKGRSNFNITKSKVMTFSHLQFKDVTGVGSIEVDFTPKKRVHTFIGENGVGKTKLLETLFQFLIYQNPIVRHNISNVQNEMLASIYIDHMDLNFLPLQDTAPTVYLGAQRRGFIKNTEKKIPTIGSFKQRLKGYLTSQIAGVENDFSSLNMNTDIEQWFISIAQSSNPFQKKQDNREIEIRTVLKLCHEIDHNIDPEFMEIAGDHRVFLKINDQKTQLSHLSTGYASIVKIIQSIISGYGYFTNEQQLQNVKGIVLIDEIESHLHLSWQSKIIPTLKTLFPNTTFYITTHSPIVLTQLDNGEAYRLQREPDGIVRSSPIKNPSNSTFVDMLEDAFGLDVNTIKLQRTSSDSQKEAKQRLLDLINEQREASDK